jgi:lycopene beta-cyclase
VGDENSDLIIVGGGLSGSLLAWCLGKAAPELRVSLIEATDRIGGNHTWSFHQNDLSPRAFSWIEPLITKSWSGQTAKFPLFERTLPLSYHSLTSDHLHEVIRTHLEGKLQFQTKTEDIGSLKAKAVFDCRGNLPYESALCGFRKFVGVDVELEEPHGLEAPILMDATVHQIDGYRFFYVLPWTETSLLVEDVRYSDHAEMNMASFRWEIEQYLANRGWQPVTYFREEVGCLPIPLQESFLEEEETPRKRSSRHAVPFLGVGAGFFHPTTGYSLVELMRAIEEIVDKKAFTSDEAIKVLARFSIDAQKRHKFFYGFNRMLFLGALPEERFQILQRVYQMPESVIHRFYRGELHGSDMVRLLWGRPPLPLKKAFEALWTQRRVTN